ncbi:hypothetical protein CAEBREN_00573 [Caenorhabditis brenneri]|uniref:GH18 domain-containing protein n=1 Tax=Caenorhabditis brenneri TaxID=135651 RepID=G0N2Z3_CAEBE|nr:hypothetical protein CAEBREN_00573 [Caenorhabditis brenneri]
MEFPPKCKKYCIWISVILFIIFGICTLYFYVDVIGGNEDQFTEASVPPASLCNKRFIGFYAAQYPLKPSQLRQLTHLVLPTLVKEYDHLVEIEGGRWNLFIKMRDLARKVNQDIKVMIALLEHDGGQRNTVDFLSRESRTDEGRKKLVDTINNFLLKHSLDGVHFDWALQNSDDSMRIKLNFLKDLREKFSNNPGQDMLISVKIPPYGSIFKNLNFAEYKKYVDFISVGTASYIDPEEIPGYVMPCSPLYKGPGIMEERTVNYTMNWLIKNVGDIGMFNIEIPTYGMRFQMSKDTERALYRRIYYFMILEDEEWNYAPEEWDDESKTPFMWNKDRSIVAKYENPRSAEEKMKYFLEKEIGGVMIIYPDMDQPKMPIFEAIAKTDWCNGH